MLKHFLDLCMGGTSSTEKRFWNLQLFELIYLLVLAFLPFFLAIREVTYSVIAILIVIAISLVYKKLAHRRINPKEHVVLITGCDSGFGNACARRLDSQGCTVVAGCLDDSSEGAQRLKQSSSGQMHVLQLDVTDEASVENCVAKVKALCRQKGLWALINNAGIFAFGDLEFTELDVYQQVSEVNLYGTIRVTKACLPLIRTAKGRVINVTGYSGQLSLPGHSAFSMSNFGLMAITDALRLEMKPFGVKVICVQPGNYSGATGMLNRSALGKLEMRIQEMKETTAEEIKSAYGANYLDKQYQQLVELSKSSASNLVKVINALEDAVSSSNPGSYYVLDGGNQLFDLSNILIKIRPFLPCAVFDQLVSKSYSTIITKS